MSKKFDFQDYYFKKAKIHKFAARSVFKLEEIDKKYRLFKKSQKILDLGAAPGSWSQYVSEKIGDQGLVVGIDLKEIEITLPNAQFFQADAFRFDFNKNLNLADESPPFDWIISDMAPKTTGVKFADQEKSYRLCLQAISLIERYLKKNGGLVIKYFHGQEYKEIEKLLKKKFSKNQAFRPKSTRKESKEIYLIGLGYLRQDPGES